MKADVGAGRVGPDSRQTHQFVNVARNSARFRELLTEALQELRTPAEAERPDHLEDPRLGGRREVCRARERLLEDPESRYDLACARALEKNLRYQGVETVSLRTPGVPGKVFPAPVNEDATSTFERSAKRFG